ncbi:hypothetical protein I3760_Q009000 [Carya illinoinensis]|nr:hypothetical protein I3760_Q009000 [Carya illinoinensis]
MTFVTRCVFLRAHMLFLHTYLLDLPGKYHVFAIFNVTTLFPFDPGGDSRTNPFEERRNDGPQGGPSRKDLLQVSE